jgi:iron complex outermembrane receptor protein
MKHSFTSLVLCLFLVSVEFILYPSICTAQTALPQKTLRGKVLFREGNTPLAGVRVSLTSTQSATKPLGANTNRNGAYSIELPEGFSTKNAVLRFSYVGCVPQEITVSESTGDIINITLEQDRLATESVVVTGLGVERDRRTLGYAVTKVEGKTIQFAQETNIIDALKGRVAGLRIDDVGGPSYAAPRMQLRGVSTLSDNAQPLIVIDGVFNENNVGGDPWENEMKNLNANDIESISVLKGAAASALYGSRAINGVILIETKKGGASQGLGVTLTQGVMVRNVVAPQLQNEFGPGSPPVNTWSTRPNPFDFTQFNKNDAGEDYIDPGYSVGWNWGPRMRGQMVRNYDGNLTPFLPQPNNYTDAFRTGFYRNTNLSLRGGNETTRFYASATLVNDQTIYHRNGFDQSAFNIRLEHRLNSIFSVELRGTYTNVRTTNPNPNSFSQLFYAMPRNFDTKYWMQNYKGALGGVPREGDPNYPLFSNLLFSTNDPSINSFFDIFENNRFRNENVLTGFVRVRADISDKFWATAEANVNNNFVLMDFRELGKEPRNVGGRYLLDQYRIQQNLLKGMLNYADTFADVLSVRAFVGAETWQTADLFNQSSTRDGLIVPGNYSLSNSVGEPVTVAGERERKRINSLYGALTLDYNDQLTLDITARNDWSSALTYSNGGGNNSYLYPSVSASWQFDKTFADALKTSLSGALSSGRLRASWAKVGADTRPYAINRGWARTGSLLTALGTTPTFGYNSSTVPNVNLQPQEKYSREAGINLGFLENRIVLDVAAYHENTYNQILELPVPIESGVNSIQINAGNIEISGVEIELHTRPIVTDEFVWEVNVNAARARTLIKEFYPGITERLLGGNPRFGERIGVMAYVGSSYGDIVTDADYLRFQARDAAGNPIDHPNNGKRQMLWSNNGRGALFQRQEGANKLTTLGNIQPDWTGGIQTRFTWNGLTFAALLDVRIGGQVYSQGMRYGTAYGALQSTVRGRDAESGGMTWTSALDGKTYQDGMIPDGVFAPGTVVRGQNLSGMTYKEAFEKGFVEPARFSMHTYWAGSWARGIPGRFVYENTFVSLRELSLGYALPAALLETISVKGLSISLVARNLGMLYTTVPDGMNPALSSAGAPNPFVGDGLQPFVISFGCNLTVRF